MESNSYLSPLHPPAVDALGEDIHHQHLEEGDGLVSAKSVESLTSLLRRLPDVVIPEPLYNPLPLQCLAANALPDLVRQEIDSVLNQYSQAISSPISSPGRILAGAAAATAGSTCVDAEGPSEGRDALVSNAGCEDDNGGDGINGDTHEEVNSCSAEEVCGWGLNVWQSPMRC